MFEQRDDLNVYCPELPPEYIDQHDRDIRDSANGRWDHGDSWSNIPHWSIDLA